MSCPRRSEAPYQITPPETDNWDKGTCSYCGSISQEDFLAAVEAGEEIGPTDKSYKAYIHSGSFRKFYFQHLDESGRAKFIELYNNKTMKLGYPGYFYTRPFFCSYKEPASE